MANMTFKANLLPDNTAAQRELGSSTAKWAINGVADPKLTDTLPTINTTGDGNAVTAVSISGSTITVTKGASYNNYTYTLPTATSGALGGIKIGYTTSNKKYAVQLDTNGNAYVDVPWTDNNTDTKVTQTNQTGANDYRILLSGSANDTTVAEGANKSTNLRFNPSIKVFSVGGDIEATGDLELTGDAYLNSETYADSLTAGSLLVTGAAAFTNTPTAPTPATTSNDTSIATTAFVKNNIGGLSGAMHYIGITSTALTDGATTSTLTAKTIGSLTKTTGFIAGDVVLYNDGEYVWNGSLWEQLGDSGSFKTRQATVTAATTASTATATTFVSAIEQDANGVIKYTTKVLPTYNNYSLPTASTTTKGGIKVGSGLTISSETLNHSNSVTAKTAYVDTATTASANGGTIKVTDVKYDAQGHITGTQDRTITLSQTTYSLSGLGGVGTVSASGTAPLTLSVSKSGTTVTISGSVADATTSTAGVWAMSGANANTLISQLPTWTADPTDDTYLIRRDTGGTASYGQVKFSTVYNYIKTKLNVTNNNINLSRNTETTIATIGGTAIKIKLPASDNTDTKQNIVLATTTKAYLTGVTTAPTSTTAAMTGVGDTGVYLTSTAGELSAVRHSFNSAGSEKAYISYNTTTNALDFVFV